MFVSIKPLHVSVFFLDHLQGVLRKSAGGRVTAQSTAKDPTEGGRETGPKHIGVLYLQTRF